MLLLMLAVGGYLLIWGLVYRGWSKVAQSLASWKKDTRILTSISSWENGKDPSMRIQREKESPTEATIRAAKVRPAGLQQIANRGASRQEDRSAKGGDLLDKDAIGQEDRENSLVKANGHGMSESNLILSTSSSEALGSSKHTPSGIQISPPGEKDDLDRRQRQRREAKLSESISQPATVVSAPEVNGNGNGSRWRNNHYVRQHGILPYQRCKAAEFAPGFFLIVHVYAMRACWCIRTKPAA